MAVLLSIALFLPFDARRRLVVVSLLLAVAVTPSASCPPLCACFTGSDGPIASCRYQNLDRVPAGLPRDIVELDVGHCQLRKLDKGTFPQLPRLRRLILDWCRVERIDEGTFSGLVAVEYIKLSHNSISDVHPLAFRGLGGLRSLHLDNNRIRILPYSLFSQLRLEELLLHNNSLQTLDDRVFEGSSIVSLNLDENNISNISIELFLPLKKSLKNFNLSHNEQPLQLDSDVFSGFTFSDLKISYDGLKDPSFLKYVRAYSLDISGHPFQKLNFTDCDNFRSLQEIYLRNLNIKALNATILGNLVAITLLDLSDNLLCRLDGKVFASTPRLRVLRLDNNTFESLPENLGVELANLEVFKVARNKLTLIRPDAFVGMDSLQELDLRDNQIQVIEESMRATFTALQTIRLAGNPLHCNCEIRWYREWLNATGKDTGAFRCTSPKRTSIYAMSPADFVCRQPNVTYVTGSMNAEEGESVYLTCTAQGDPAPKVEWSSPFGEMVSVTPPVNRTRYVTYAIWHVSIIQLEQAGWYTCKATNRVGTSHRSMYIHVYEPGGSTIDVGILTPSTTTPVKTTSTTTTTPTTTPTTTTTTVRTTTTSTTTTTITSTTTVRRPTTTGTTRSTTKVTTTPRATKNTPPTYVETATATMTTKMELPETTTGGFLQGKAENDKDDQSAVPTWIIVVTVVSIVCAIILVTLVSMCVYRAVNRKYKRKYDVNRDDNRYRANGNNNTNR